MIEEVPDDHGTYILLCCVDQMRRLEIGRMGVFDIVPGHYAYVGSACGAGGLRARLQHHLDSIASPHWHIDYLLQFARPTEVWFAVSDRRMEQDWAELLEHSHKLRAPIPRFGSSDYRRSRTAHLFYSKKMPAFRWFRELIAETYEPLIRVEQRIFGQSGPDANLGNRTGRLTKSRLERGL